MLRSLCCLAALFLLAACDSDPVDLDGLLSLQVTDGEAVLPADGFSRITITASVEQDEIDGDKRAILFTTSSGTLLGGVAEGSGRKVTLDTGRRATIQLQAGTDVGTAVVRASVVGAEAVTEEMEVELVAPSSSDILGIAPLPPSAPADGATLTPITVEIADALPLAMRTVTVTTSLGTFASTNLTTVSAIADASGSVTMNLKSPQSTGRAWIRASVGSFSRQTSIDIVRADPERVVVDPGGFSLQASLERSVTVRAQLQRSVGTATPGTPVSFAATDSLGQAIGFWRLVIPSNNTGEATAVFSVGATEYRGVVTLEARALPSSVSGTAPIQIIAPEG